jgi:hypothetical protein
MPQAITIDFMNLFKLGLYIGFGYAVFRQLNKDVNGLGRRQRDNESRAERRWKHEIADQVEELEPKEKAKRLAHRIREDAWRD